MGDDSITPADVQGRTQTQKLIGMDSRAALKCARAIRHPWYRCQAIAMVAEADSDVERRDKLLEESLTAAFEQVEPNRIVTVATWPLKQLVRVAPGKAHDVVLRLLATISREPHGLRKLDGLACMLHPVIRVGELRGLVLPPFLAAAANSAGWRTERIVAEVAEAIADHDVETAFALLESRTPSRFSRRADARLRAVIASRIGSQPMMPR